MADRYIVKSSLISRKFGSFIYLKEREALFKTAELLDKHGSNLKVEIFLNDLPPPLWSAKRISDWDKSGRPNMAVYDR